MRNYLLFVIALLVLNSGCAITHKYGPYMGKVVEKETGKPIAGAVVFMKFMTVGIYEVHKFAGAVEVLTNENGEFHIPVQRANTFQIGGAWDEDPSVIIFKPGYGAYPRHRKSGPLFIPNGSIPENKHVTVKLPKLKTKEERKKNLRNIPNINAPSDKYKILRNFKSLEVGATHEKWTP